ncbi:hypothetical protein FBZ83_1209 [Azospirillum brasilense]|uniref:Uncharacterized protein n=1 Tax=Azospirillum brasilense TaxID=192 RepID=A0A560BTT8_AZOBR|nr:hypothetical protein FBZ83_1209 [Azospirillum brasilense]
MPQLMHVSAMPLVLIPRMAKLRMRKGRRGGGAPSLSLL